MRMSLVLDPVYTLCVPIKVQLQRIAQEGKKRKEKKKLK